MENVPDIAVQMTTALALDAAARGDAEEAERLWLKLPQTECPVFHHFGPKFCIREMHIPAGTFVIGHEHREPLANMLVKGRMKVYAGGVWSVMEAPLFFVGTPGRKMALALTDSIWQNILVTDETDISKIEEQFVVKSDEWLNHQKLLEKAK